MRRMECITKGDLIDTPNAVYEILGLHGRYNYTQILEVRVTEWDFEKDEEKEPYDTIITVFDLECLAREFDGKNHCFRYTA